MLDWLESSFIQIVYSISVFQLLLNTYENINNFNINKIAKLLYCFNSNNIFFLKKIVIKYSK